MVSPVPLNQPWGVCRPVYVIWMNPNTMICPKQNKDQKTYRIFYEIYCTWSSRAGMAYLPWWRHQTETFSALLALCAGNLPVTGKFPSHRPMTWSFFFGSPPLINGWVNNREAGDFRRNRAHYDAIVMHVWSTSLYATHVMPSLIHRYLAHLLIKKSISHRTSSSPRRKYYTSFFSLNATFQISIYGTSI